MDDFALKIAEATRCVAGCGRRGSGAGPLWASSGVGFPEGRGVRASARVHECGQRAFGSTARRRGGRSIRAARCSRRRRPRRSRRDGRCGGRTRSSGMAGGARVRAPGVPRRTWRRPGAWSCRGCGCRPSAAHSGPGTPGRRSAQTRRAPRRAPWRRAVGQARRLHGACAGGQQGAPARVPSRGGAGARGRHRAGHRGRAVEPRPPRRSRRPPARNGLHVQLEERVEEAGGLYRASGNLLVDRLLGATLHSFPLGEDEVAADAALERLAGRSRTRAAGRTSFAPRRGTRRSAGSATSWRSRRSRRRPRLSASGSTPSGAPRAAASPTRASSWACGRWASGRRCRASACGGTPAGRAPAWSRSPPSLRR